MRKIPCVYRLRHRYVTIRCHSQPEQLGPAGGLWWSWRHAGKASAACPWWGWRRWPGRVAGVGGVAGWWLGGDGVSGGVGGVGGPGVAGAGGVVVGDGSVGAGV